VQQFERFALDEILEYMPDGMFIIDTNLIIQYTNAAFCNLLGFSREELIGSAITDHLGDLKILDTCMSAVMERGHCSDQQTVFRKKDGSFVHISKNVQALYSNDYTINNILVSIRDLTALQKYNADLEALVDARTSEIEHQLYFDSLTALPNRQKLLNDTHQLDTDHLVILFNIDRFNELNTFYGNAIGDQLLQQIGNFLIELTTHFDNAQIYKLPVDEYAILIRPPYSTQEVDIFIHLLMQKILDKTFRVQNEEVQISATLGIAFSTGQVDDLSLMMRAGMALKLAKKLEKSHHYYNPDQHIKEDYEHNLVWIKKLRSALEEDRIVPFYQPIVNAKTKKIEKYEALVRIIENDGTVISPFEFLEISKKVKLYHHITKIMVNKVFTMLENNKKIICTVNLSIEDINNDLTRNYLISKVKHSECSDRVIFEILESEGIENYEIVHEFITEVKRYGVKIALDDFGAGYSNFAYITKLDIDFIKIDGSIIRNIHTDPVSKIIAKTLVDFATQLGIKTVAEFVSSQEISDYLIDLPLTHMQGYYYGEPSADLK